MKFVQDSGRYILKFDKGEEVVEGLAGFIKDQNISSAWVSGLGGLSAVSIGYFDQNELKYCWQDYAGSLELTNLTGNIARQDDEPALHLHATVSDESLKCVGGHLKSAVVGGTVEVLVTPLEDMSLTRQKDQATGLNLLNL